MCQLHRLKGPEPSGRGAGAGAGADATPQPREQNEVACRGRRDMKLGGTRKQENNWRQQKWCHGGLDREKELIRERERDQKKRESSIVAWTRSGMRGERTKEWGGGRKKGKADVGHRTSQHPLAEPPLNNILIPIILYAATHDTWL